MRYREAGVDVARADALKADLGPILAATWGDAVRPLPGGFAGLVRWPARPGDGGPAAPDERLIAATMDGVGTKLHLALACGRVADAAADLVYHCANDLLAHGARPVAFLDYVAQGRLERDVIRDVVAGLGRACLEVGAALIGGETAEMPDTYRPGVVDLAGCMIGSVAAAAVLDGEGVEPGDVVLGLGSTGLHTNGYSLARRVLSGSGLRTADPLPGGNGETVADALLAPHRWYGRTLLAEASRPRGPGRRIRGLAHVTGGGLAGNLVRALPPGRRARLRSGAWPRPAVFRWIVEAGRVPEEDARRTLNLGIGMAVIAAGAEAAALARDLTGAGETVHVIGDVVAGERGVDWLEV